MGSGRPGVMPAGRRGDVHGCAQNRALPIWLGKRRFCYYVDRAFAAFYTTQNPLPGRGSFFLEG